MMATKRCIARVHRLDSVDTDSEAVDDLAFLSRSVVTAFQRITENMF